MVAPAAAAFIADDGLFLRLLQRQLNAATCRSRHSFFLRSFQQPLIKFLDAKGGRPVQNLFTVSDFLSTG